MELESNNKTVDNFIFESTNLTSELVGNIIQDIQGLPVISTLSSQRRDSLIGSLMSDISRFVEISTLLSKLILQKSATELERVKQSHVHLLFVMKAIGQAQHKQDLMALEELIKYELKDNLTQWKIDLIPQTRRLIKNEQFT